MSELNTPSVADLLKNPDFVRDARLDTSTNALQSLYAPLMDVRQVRTAKSLAIDLGDVLREIIATGQTRVDSATNPVNEKRPSLLTDKPEQPYVAAPDPVLAAAADKVWSRPVHPTSIDVSWVKPDGERLDYPHHVQKNNVRTATVEHHPITPPQPECTVFLPDIHFPHQDKAAVAGALKLIAHLHPTSVYLLGDVHDNPQMSQYARTLEADLQLQSDLDAIDAFLTELRSVTGPDCKITWTEGNHETRNQTWIQTQGRHLSTLRYFKPEEYYKLDKHRITWVPISETHVHHNVVVTHGTIVRGASGASAKGELAKYGMSGISGHVHRLGMYRTHTLGGDDCWFEAGCLCNLNPDYCKNPNWHQGLAVGYFLPEQKRFQIDLVPIFDGTLLYHGQLFSGK